VDWGERLRQLLGGSRATAAPDPSAARTAPAAAPMVQAPLRPRVAVVVFDPPLPDRGGRRLTEVCGFADPRALARDYVADLAETSGGYVQYEIVDWVALDVLPRKLDGYQYGGEAWLRCWERGGGWHEPDGVDYPLLLATFDVPGRVAAGTLDELWLFGPPYAGFYESRMVGKGATWCNAPPLEGVACARRFVVMGFNYERGVGEMLENFGHRVESLLAQAYGDAPPGHAWDRFSAYDAAAPGRAGCGNVHFAPNSVRDYDWGNRTPVWSTCDAWPRYPAPAGERRRVDCREWGGGDIRAHHRWWLAHLARAAGRHDGHLANWWTYAVDVNGAR